MPQRVATGILFTQCNKCMSNNLLMIQILLKHGASKDIKDQEGLTPLDVSKQYGDDSDVAKLLQHEGTHELM